LATVPSINFSYKVDDLERNLEAIGTQIMEKFGENPNLDRFLTHFRFQWKFYIYGQHRP